ncbi:hypothetical protein EDB80DRAFT_747303 [Ilyonectria destructans]|nr:hypothetical protein EDB80DRAFT_747303 [Ilyonectria destructans]
MTAKKLVNVAAMLGSGFAACSRDTTRNLNLAPNYYNRTIAAEHLSVEGNLDGFKMLAPAAVKSADFWYFDVFSQATNQTLNILSGAYANGTDFYYEAIANDGFTLSNGPGGIVGNWEGIGSFQGSALDKADVEYSITINSPEMGIDGTVDFKAIAPAHYPCDLNDAANAVPDAETVVNLRVQDTAIEFTDGVGNVLLVSCELESLEVRQKGGKAAWPPTTGLLGTEGLTVKYTLPDGETLAPDITTEFIGGIVGQEIYEGKAHYEEFIFGTVNNYKPQV